jgi:hypothetical protein
MHPGHFASFQSAASQLVSRSASQQGRVTRCPGTLAANRLPGTLLPGDVSWGAAGQGPSGRKLKC